MPIEIKLQAFEGPLDLLLHLIDKNKVNIYDIPIALITSQYMEYLEKLRESEAILDTMSEFLVMAATLLDIKSRMLLPVEKNEEGEEIDPRDELVRQLLEYKMYRFMSAKLREREDDASRVCYRKGAVPREVASYREPVDVGALLDEANITLPGLYKIFQEVMKRREDRKDPIRSGFGRIEKEEIDTEKTMHYVQQYIMKKGRCTFRSILSLKNGKMYTVVAFLTILELMKRGHIYVKQNEIFGEIEIEANSPSMWTDEDDDLMSEWGEENEEDKQD